ncbi:MAG: cation-translocating P-type ATPase [Clostridiales Family XIII bacterium]|jgi:Ca2+-transporting ATPase|nr:cation-translocating P-type ATPase [Clostridiales Family XIII bacterium]
MYEQLTTADALEALRVDRAVGLPAEEAAERFARFGPNAFAEGEKKTLIKMFLAQLKDPMIYILMAAALVSAVLREIADTVIILIVVLLNAVIGVVQESKAEKSLEALKKLSSPTALVRRGGKVAEIAAEKLVPGDIVILDAGRVVPADLRLTESINLKIEESSLTGESVPADKDAGFVAAGEITLGDRLNMAYMSTSVAYGRGEGVVVLTGMNTEIGKIARMINESKEELTPLQKRLADLGKLLGILAVALCAALFLLALLQGRNIMEMLLTAISLAVAAVPEGLPAVVTIVLALGVQRMVKVGSIVRKLPAVETLGSVSTVCSDKTGTLTQNKMTVTKVWTLGGMRDVSEMEYGAYKLLVDGFVLCTDAEADAETGVRAGDPTELALIDLGAGLSVRKNALCAELPRVAEQAFDSDRKMMTTVHRRVSDARLIAFTKGAMDCVIKCCDAILPGGDITAEAASRPLTPADREAIEAAAANMAADALRVLAVAYKLDDADAREARLTFVGLAGMIDPPRPEARDAVEVFRGASVTTVMITGDHRDTAFAIAKELSIADSPAQCITGDELSKMSEAERNARVPDLRVFARVSPEHKVMIVNAFRARGQIVSMTGDGVNDAPSLKAADIGVAMGITGTDVAKGAADMVLTDDNFATIKSAIEEGRNIYNNIKKTVLFLLSSNLGEILTMFAAITAGLASPLRAIHILWINLITDSLPALALGADTGDPRIMEEAPRNPKDSLFAHGGLATTICYGAIIGAITLAAFLWAPAAALRAAGEALTLGNLDAAFADPLLYRTAQTYAFTTLAVSQLFNAIGFRNLKRSIFRMNHIENKMMVVAFFVGLVLQVAVTELPVLSEAFDTVALSLGEWLRLAALCTAPLWFHELRLLALRIARGPGPR